MRSELTIRASAAGAAPVKFQRVGTTKAAQPDEVPAFLAIVVTPTAEILAAAASDSVPFKMLAYTGVPMRLKEFPYPVIVDAAGLTIANQVLPILKDHVQTQVVGHSKSITLDRHTGAIDVDLIASGSGPAADEVRSNAKAGFPWQASIGAPVQELQFVDEGENVTVNGRNWPGPLYVARKATLREISFVALGGDGATVARIAAAAASLLEGAKTMEFEIWVKAMGLDPATLTPDQKKGMQATYDAKKVEAAKLPPVTPPVTPPTVEAQAQAFVAEMRKAAAEETKRVTAIRRHCSHLPEIEAKAISEGWTESQAELEALRLGRAQGPFIHTGAGNAEINASACFEAALCIKAGIGEKKVGGWFDQKVMNEAVGERYKGASLSNLMFEVIRAAGMHTRIGAITDETIRTAMRAEKRLRAMTIQAAGFSTLSLSGTLSNVANKAMIAAYDAQDVVWPKFCKVRDHSDFKVMTRYRLDASGSMRKVGADGELKHITMSETSFTNQLDTYGCLISLTRQMQINDDLGAFLEIPNILGRLAAIRPEEAFFVLLLANATSFFATGNNNIITGAGGVLTAANGLAAITAAETKFRNQVDGNNKPALIRPARMLCGTVNYVPARNIYEGRMKITGKDQTEVSQNEHAGKYEPYESAFMNNTSVLDENGAAITGQSTTKWFLFADPEERAAVGMAFLNGQKTPQIESDDVEFSVLGMQWRCFHDFGVGYEDPKAAVQNDGA